MELLPGVVLHHLVEADHSHQEGGLVDAVVRLAVQVHGEQRERSVLSHVEQLGDELPLLDVGLGHHLDPLGEQAEQLGIVLMGLVRDPGQVDGDVLHRGIAHLPWRLRVVQVRLVELERQPAALRDLGSIAAIEHEVGVALLRCDLGDLQEELLVTFGLEELVRHVDVRLGEEERPSHGVPFHVYVEQRLDEPLSFRQVVIIGLAGELAVGPDGRDPAEVVGDLPVQVEVGEYGLAATSDRLLRELVDEYLGELLHALVVHVDEVRRKEQVERIPSDGSGEVALQGRRELDDLLYQHLGVLGRLGDAQRVRKVEAELLDVFDGLPRAIGPVDHSEVVKVNVAAHVRVRQVLREHFQQSELLLDVLRQRKIGGLRPMGNVGVLLVGGHDDLPGVVQRNAQAGVLLAYLRQTVLDQLGVRQLADERCGDKLDLKLGDHLLDLASDDGCGVLADGRLPHEGIVDLDAVPLLEILIGSPHEKRELC